MTKRTKAETGDRLGLGVKQEGLTRGHISWTTRPLYSGFGGPVILHTMADIELQKREM